MPSIPTTLVSGATFVTPRRHNEHSDCAKWREGVFTGLLCGEEKKGVTACQADSPEESEATTWFLRRQPVASDHSDEGTILMARQDRIIHPARRLVFGYVRVKAPPTRPTRACRGLAEQQRRIEGALHRAELAADRRCLSSAVSAARCRSPSGLKQRAAAGATAALAISSYRQSSTGCSAPVWPDALQTIQLLKDWR